MELNQENLIEGLVSLDTSVEGDLNWVGYVNPIWKTEYYNTNFVFLVKENDVVDFDIDQHIKYLPSDQS